MRPATRILLVEDEPQLAQNIVSFLERDFAEVRLARNGGRALEMLKWFSPHVAVLDYGLPGMNGAELYRALKEASPHPLPCVMITGYPPERLAPEAALEGVAHVLAKPFSLETLVRLIKAWSEGDAT